MAPRTLREEIEALVDGGQLRAPLVARAARAAQEQVAEAVALGRPHSGGDSDSDRDEDGAAAGAGGERSTATAGAMQGGSAANLAASLAAGPMVHVFS